MNLDKQKVDALFEDHVDQGTILIELYKMVIHKWNDIVRIDGHPGVNDFTWKYIAKKFMELDRKYHPEVLQGGLWMNRGFTVLPERLGLRDWEVSLTKAKLVYKD